jgi:hypothetical protein
MNTGRLQPSFVRSTYHRCAFGLTPAAPGAGRYELNTIRRPSREMAGYRSENSPPRLTTAGRVQPVAVRFDE